MIKISWWFPSRLNMIKFLVKVSTYKRKVRSVHVWENCGVMMSWKKWFLVHEQEEVKQQQQPTWQDIVSSLLKTEKNWNSQHARRSTIAWNFKFQALGISISNVNYCNNSVQSKLFAVKLSRRFIGSPESSMCHQENFFASHNISCNRIRHTNDLIFCRKQ